ncbi:MAG: hypothetical protein JO041_04080 [Acidobacteria bacterium]|nr:hypothetical protein [Acidobacteriota bacterium]
MTVWRLMAAVLLTIFFVAVSDAQSWQPINNAPPFNPGAMLLLTDGSVLVHSEPNCNTCQSTDYQSWYKLTPDINGSYVNGTWSKVATPPNGYAPLFFSSAVLPDGRVLVEGGEYQNGAAAWQTGGAIYDPVKNTWTAVAPPPGWTTIGDAQNVILPNGTYMQANCCTRQEAAFNPTNLTWTELAGKNKFDIHDEEGWTLLPNGKVLTVDAYVGQYNATGTNSEIYNPATQTWSSAGSTIVQLWDSCNGVSQNASYELGPGVLRPDGTVFYSGAESCGTAHTAVYNSRTGVWTAGPDFPGIYSVSDGPAALEPNGNVLVFASPNTFYPPAGEFFEWNGATLSEMTPPPTALADSSFVGHLMVLPTGQIMFTDYSTNVEILNPAGSPQPGWEPTILNYPSSVQLGHSYQLAGTQFNGLSAANAYGDDYQAATNFPLVRIVNNATGHVFYCRTHNHSTMAVATGSQRVSTHFDVPANMETGPSQLFVVANGISSSPVFVNVTPASNRH